MTYGELVAYGIGAGLGARFMVEAIRQPLAVLYSLIASMFGK